MKQLFTICHRNARMRKVDPMQYSSVSGTVNDRRRLCKQLTEVHRKYRRNSIGIRFLKSRKLNKLSSQFDRF